MRIYALTFLALIIGGSSATGKTLEYHQLRFKELDEMQALIHQKVVRADRLAKGSESAQQESIEHLREALKIVFSRPDTDNLRSKLLAPIRKKLKKMNAWEDTVVSLVSEAIRTIRRKKANSKRKTTAYFILINYLSEFRPLVSSEPSVKEVFEKVRDAKIKVPSEVRKELRKSMYKVYSPSDIAESVIKQKSS